jgi:predicted O-methyltransferase YrrM
MNIQKALAISDYINDDRVREIQWLANQAERSRIIVEVGSWKGCTTRALADNTSGTVYAVDTFKGSKNEEKHQRLDEHPEDWLYHTFLTNTAGIPNLITMRMDSVEAAAELAKKGIRPNMVFLDASHDYDSVKADILAWLPLLAPKGLLCGHDCDWDGVLQATAELVPNRMRSVGAIWYKVPE